MWPTDLIFVIESHGYSCCYLLNQGSLPSRPHRLHSARNILKSQERQNQDSSERPKADEISPVCWKGKHRTVEIGIVEAAKRRSKAVRALLDMSSRQLPLLPVSKHLGKTTTRPRPIHPDVSLVFNIFLYGPVLPVI